MWYKIMPIICLEIVPEQNLLQLRKKMIVLKDGIMKNIFGNKALVLQTALSPLLQYFNSMDIKPEMTSIKANSRKHLQTVLIERTVRG